MSGEDSTGPARSALADWVVNTVPLLLPSLLAIANLDTVDRAAVIRSMTEAEATSDDALGASEVFRAVFTCADVCAAQRNRWADEQGIAHDWDAGLPDA